MVAVTSLLTPQLLCFACMNVYGVMHSTGDPTPMPVISGKRINVLQAVQKAASSKDLQGS